MSVGGNKNQQGAPTQRPASLPPLEGAGPNLSCSQSNEAMGQKRNERDLVIRRLHSADFKKICDHFRRLDVDSRRARFCGAVSDKGVTKYAQCIIRFDSFVCGAFIGGHVRGLAELHRVRLLGPSTTEAALSVELDWQNAGIGDALFERMIAMAQNRGVRSIQLNCLKENSRMRYLAAKHGARQIFDQDMVEAILIPYWPTPASVAKEILGETKGATHWFSR